MLCSGGLTFSDFLVDVLSIFIFVLWFWLLITVFGDLFRRHDISGWTKAIWVIVLIIFPYLGIFIFLITQHRGMAERQSQQVQQAREDTRHFIGYSVADQLEPADQRLQCPFVFALRAEIRQRYPSELRIDSRSAMSALSSSGGKPRASKASSFSSLAAGGSARENPAARPIWSMNG